MLYMLSHMLYMLSLYVVNVVSICCIYCLHMMYMLALYVEYVASIFCVCCLYVVYACCIYVVYCIYCICMLYICCICCIYCIYCIYVITKPSKIQLTTYPFRVPRRPPRTIPGGGYMCVGGGGMLTQ